MVELERKFAAGDLPEQQLPGAALPTRHCPKCRTKSGRQSIAIGAPDTPECALCSGSARVTFARHAEYMANRKAPRRRSGAHE